MHRFFKTIALSILAVSLASLDWVIWFSLHLPFDLDATKLELNRNLVPWAWLVRGCITAILLWTFFYLKAHCVIASREESTRIVMRG